MKRLLEGFQLGTRLGRRIFTLFLVCAVLPGTLLIAGSTQWVRRSLMGEYELRIQREAKNDAMAVLDRLLALREELEIFSRRGLAGPVPLSALSDHFIAVASASTGGKWQFAGGVTVPLDLNEKQESHLLEGGALIVHGGSRDGRAALAIVVLTQRRIGAPHSVLVGLVEAGYLWGGVTRENPLPAETEALVFDPAGKTVFSSFPGSETLIAHVREQDSPTLGSVLWEGTKGPELAGYWTLPLLYQFQSPGLTFLRSQPESYLFGAYKRLRNSVVFTLVAAMGAVLLISVRELRRGLGPLEQLQGFTQLVAAGDFEAEVEIHSGDEFEGLGHDFNRMSRDLGRQFKTLESSNQIVRSILSSSSRGETIRTAVRQFPKYASLTYVGIRSFERSAPSRAIGYGRFLDEERVFPTRDELSVEEIERLSKGLEGERFSNVAGSPPSYAARALKSGGEMALAFPLRSGHNLVGVLTLGFSDQEGPSEAEADSMHQLADQIAVGLANAQVIQRLDDLSLGALLALARTVDASSPWTAGHSERVATVAMLLGQEIGLDDTRLDIIERGCLLHDIGKISVPAAILDKKGKLTEQERRIVQGHVMAGVEIVEPIPGFEPLLPIVRQHHEWWDGNGYPDGISGREISPEGRIVAVADCFDALSSERPYRRALPRDVVMEIIEEGCGTQFDPEVLRVFQDIEARGGLPGQGRTSSAMA